MTKDEQKRLEHFNKVTRKLINEGYEVSETSMGIVKANVLTLLILGPLAYFILKLYGIIYSPDNIFYLVLDTQMITLLVVAILLLTIAHELLHGMTWAIFTPNGFKDVAFGFILKYLTPYCSFKVSL